MAEKQDLLISEHIKDDSLAVIVKPNSAKNRVLEYDKSRDALRIEIKAPAEDNKANIEVIKFFSKITKKKVKIISGLTSKLKILRFS